MVCQSVSKNSIDQSQRFEGECRNTLGVATGPLAGAGLRLPTFEIAKRVALAIGVMSGEFALGEELRLGSVLTPAHETAAVGSPVSGSVIDFLNMPSSDRSVREQLTKFLGASDADLLVVDLRDQLVEAQSIHRPTPCALFIELNEKDRRAQGVAMEAVGYEFADDCTATLRCAHLLGRAREAGIDVTKPSHLWRDLQGETLETISQGEHELLACLRDGFVRTRSGALRIDGDGHLRFHPPCNFGSPIRWALGSPMTVK